MDVLLKSLTAIWQVALGALILGAGLPIVFALGLKSLSAGRVVTAGADGTTVATGTTTAAGKLGAIICFAVVVAAILFGIVVLIWGKQLFGK